MTQQNGPTPPERPEGFRNRPLAYGSDLIAELLRRLEVPFIALNPGASFRGLHDSLVNYLGNERPQLLLALHETQAVSIAHGWAKVRGEPMAVALHDTVGLLNAAMAIFNAWCDRVPMLLIGGTGHVDSARRRPWIEWIHTSIDPGAPIRGYVKWDDRPASPQAAVESLLRAVQLTRTAPAGPTYVCLDVALQESRFASGETALPEVKRFRAAPRPQPRDIDIAELSRLLRSSRRPLLLFGRGSRGDEDWGARVELAEAVGGTVLTDLKQGAVFPTDHPLHPVAPGFEPGETARALARESDLIVSFDWIDLAGFLQGCELEPSARLRIVHCSLDTYAHRAWSMDYQALPPLDLNVLADPDECVHALVRAGAARRGKKARKRAGGDAVDTGSARRSGGRLALHDIAEVLASKRRATALSLVRVALNWPAAAYPFRDPLDYIGYDGGGGIGSGPGMAVGAALALRGAGRCPVAVTGDGDLLMGNTALWTAAHYRIPVLFVIANNRSFHNDEQHQERIAQVRRRPRANKWIGQRIDDPAVDIAHLARAQGVEASGPIRTREELERGIAVGLEAVKAGRPYLLDVLIDSDRR